MEMRLLRGDEMALFYTRDLDSAFPAAELKPLRAMEAARQTGKYHPWGLFDGDDLVGGAFTWEYAPGWVLFDYLCVARHRRNDGLHQFLRMFRLLHQCTSCMRLDHFIHRTSHINIDDITACLLIQQFCRIDHAFNIMSENLQAHRMFIIHDLRHMQCFYIIIKQSLVADHLGTDKSGPEPLADAAKGNIGNPCHWRDDQTVGNLHITDRPASFCG